MKNKALTQNVNILAIIACLLWSSAFVGIKIGLEHHSPLQFAGFRFTLSGILLAIYFGKPRIYLAQIKKEWIFVIKITFVQTILQYSLFYTGINMLPASISAMIIGASPLIAAILAHFLMIDDRLNKIKLISMTLGFVGIILISFSKKSNGIAESVSLLGIAILILNNIVAGYSNIMVAKNPNKMSPIVLSSSTLFSGGLCLILISIPIEGNTLHDINANYILSLSWLSLLSAIAFGIWYSLLKISSVKVSELNIWKFLIPVFGAMLAWIIIPEEKAQLISVIGMILIGLSLLILNHKSNKTIHK